MKLSANRFGFLSRLLCYYLAFFFLAEPAFAQTPQITRETLQQSTSHQRVQDSVPSLREQTESSMQGFESKPSGPGVNSVDNLDPLSKLTEQKIKVHVLGDVLNPGVYTVTVSDRVTDVLGMAVLKRTSQRVVTVRHYNDKAQGYDLYRYLYEGNLAQNPFLQDNDVVFVPTQPGAVRVEGPVGRNGIFELNGEKNLAAVIRLAGGFTAGAAKADTIRVIRVNEFGQKFTLESAFDSGALKSFQIEKGDVIVIPDLLNKPAKFDYSIETLPGENAFYPTARPDIFVVGAVFTPGAYPYKSHLTVKDYIGYAGATDAARLSSASVVRGGKRRTVKMNTSVNPGDMVIVKTKGLNNVGTLVGFASAIISLTLSTILIKQQLSN
jgi:protein involved in polysaccharide export with SLBB domain